ncbi:ArsR/SmtB family transcription factor [Actinoplanes siamensis]|uniref:Transcriptional regulator n=1 Tax=Actinoplanes siamensis TaxID=1223317 RepID=A0A919NDF1_9ACTN|nr:metalloregulator ArsR/SmtB family transcription factor [Actinoplanes siamensis]GIF08705.1 transcriptional regulator [Actinoplanes siamensis]
MTDLHSPYEPGAFTADQAEALAGHLKAIADPMRLRILHQLTWHGPLRPAELVAELGLKQPTISHHLRILREAGLIKEPATVTDGREIDFDAARALSVLIDPTVEDR